MSIAIVGSVAASATVAAKTRRDTEGAGIVVHERGRDMLRRPTFASAANSSGGDKIDQACDGCGTAER